MREMDIDTLKKIYKNIGDDSSRSVFLARFMLSMTGEAKYIYQLVRSNAALNSFFTEVYSHCDLKKRIVIMGCGYRGKQLANAYPDINWDCFIDNNPTCSQINGKPVYSVRDFVKDYTDEIIVIASRIYEQQMYDQLLEAGIPERNIMNYGKILEGVMKSQYFDLQDFPYSKNEVFVDLGCYDGKSAEELKNKIGENLKKIIAFEPDLNRIPVCREKLDELNIDYRLIDKGCWSKEATMHFEMSENGLVTLTDDGIGECVKVTTIDQALSQDEVTFIKMDIEGSELMTLMGGEETIKKKRPKFAISVYHRDEDIISIPSYILQCCEEYIFYFRHYSPIGTETVLYAIPKNQV